MIDPRRTLLIAAVMASLLSLGFSAGDVHEGAAATSMGRELDEMKCICFPCGGHCVYPSPPPPPPSLPPPKPYCPPQPWFPPRPWTPPQPWSPPYAWVTPGGTLYPVDPGFISGARRSFAGVWLLLMQLLLVWCGLLALWI